MNKKLILSIILISWIILSTSAFAFRWKNINPWNNQIQNTQNTNWFKQRNNYGKQKSQRNNSSMTNITITEEIRQWLILMREEEKLARDIYLELDKIYQTNVFGNIAKSEQKHIDAIKTILDKYNIPDPITNDQIWVFTNPELQKLYDDLLTKWQNSLSDWIQVWIDIEKLDIADLQKLISQTTAWTDLYQVYQNLLKWSQNHLKAFQRQL